MTAIDDAQNQKQSAITYFRCWLLIATAMSLAGNIAQAALAAPADRRMFAIGLAFVAPLVQVATTHALSVLVRCQLSGWAYYINVAFTVALAAGAFRLSFDHVASFAVWVGWRESIAWLVPVVIDAGIAHATYCLVVVNPPKRANRDAVGERQSPGSAVPEATMPARPASEEEPANPEPTMCPDRPETESNRSAAAQVSALHMTPHAAQPALAVAAQRPVSELRPAPEDTTPANPLQQRFLTRAEALVDRGVTSKDPELVAAVLAEDAAGTPPNTISGKLRIHHTTVNRILDGDRELALAVS